MRSAARIIPSIWLGVVVLTWGCAFDRDSRLIPTTTVTQRTPTSTASATPTYTPTLPPPTSTLTPTVTPDLLFFDPNHTFPNRYNLEFDQGYLPNSQNVFPDDLVPITTQTRGRSDYLAVRIYNYPVTHVRVLDEQQQVHWFNAWDPVIRSDGSYNYNAIAQQIRMLKRYPGYSISHVQNAGDPAWLKGRVTLTPRETINMDVVGYERSPGKAFLVTCSEQYARYYFSQNPLEISAHHSVKDSRQGFKEVSFKIAEDRYCYMIEEEQYQRIDYRTRQSVHVLSFFVDTDPEVEQDKELYVLYREPGGKKEDGLLIDFSDIYRHVGLKQPWGKYSDPNEKASVFVTWSEYLSSKDYIELDITSQIKKYHVVCQGGW